MTGIQALGQLAQEIELARAKIVEDERKSDLGEVLSALDALAQWLQQHGGHDEKQRVLDAMASIGWVSESSLIREPRAGLLSGVCALLKALLR